ncbi:hypothetical protein CHS0354_039543 [Potamilus streckersoni]|uniref:EGF-like domain-containing protein n=1 Tax=Potamilus streckersoni TaxID=2493646 RepID=A0AAE0TKP9_9BIVA|nr:hypothetical protein CHS0354_039543 [Potamilus streckersoni]
MSYSSLLDSNEGSHFEILSHQYQHGRPSVYAEQFSFTFFQHAPGKGFLTVTLVQFDNNDGKTWTGNCCDGVLSGSTCYPDECDSYFDICLQDTAFLTAGECGFGQVTTGVIPNDDHINFGNDIGGTINPINFAFENWKGAVLKIEAIDDDIQEGRDSADDKIESVQLLIVGTPDPNGVQKNVIRQSLQGNTIRMQIEYNILCQPNFYDDCSVYCQPVSDHYACSDNGWTGDDCSIDIDDCLTHTCQHEATCENIVNGFICICPAGYTGYLCELAIPFTTKTITFPTPSPPTTTITTAIIPTERNATTLSDKALSTSVAVFTSKINSMKTNISMTAATVLESTDSTSSPFVSATILKSTTTNINIHCKVVSANSSDPGMVHVRDLNVNQMDFFQGSLLQRLQNITGLQANQLKIHVLNKVQNQNGQINISIFVTSINNVSIDSLLYDAVQVLCLPAKFQSTARLQENDENLDTGLMVGVIIGSLSGLAALCGPLYLLVKRMKERQNKVSPSYTVEKKIDCGKKNCEYLETKKKGKHSGYF